MKGVKGRYLKRMPEGYYGYDECTVSEKTLPR